MQHWNRKTGTQVDSEQCKRADGCLSEYKSPSREEKGAGQSKSQARVHLHDQPLINLQVAASLVVAPSGESFSRCPVGPGRTHINMAMMGSAVQKRGTTSSRGYICRIGVP